MTLKDKQQEEVLRPWVEPVIIIYLWHYTPCGVLPLSLKEYTILFLGGLVNIQSVAISVPISSVSCCSLAFLYFQIFDLSFFV